MSLTAMDLVTNAKQNMTEISVSEAQQALHDHLIIGVREATVFAADQIPNVVSLAGSYKTWTES